MYGFSLQNPQPGGRGSVVQIVKDFSSILVGQLGTCSKGDTVDTNMARIAMPPMIDSPLSSCWTGLIFLLFLRFIFVIEDVPDINKVIALVLVLGQLSPANPDFSHGV